MKQFQILQRDLNNPFVKWDSAHHRLESGNSTFQNKQKITTGLENTFAGSGWPWKTHKSKDLIFYIESIPNIFLNSKEIFFRDRKKNRGEMSEKFRKIGKIKKILQICFFEICSTVQGV